MSSYVAVSPFMARLLRVFRYHVITEHLACLDLLIINRGKGTDLDSKTLKIPRSLTSLSTYVFTLSRDHFWFPQTETLSSTLLL